METAWLERYTVADLPLPEPLIFLRQGEDSLFRAIDKLAENRLLSLPVLSASDQLVGVLDALDVVADVVGRAGEARFTDRPLEEVVGLSRLSSEARGAGEAPEAPEAREAGQAPRDSSVQVTLETPLDSVAAVLSGRARRAVVINADGTVRSVVTQSVLLRFLHAKKEEVGQATLQIPASELCTKHVLCVGEETTALDAFETIHRHGVSSVGIVDERGALISVISCTDLVVGLTMKGDKGKIAAIRELKAMTVLDFVARNRQLNLKARAATVTVSPEQTMERILEKLAACRVHRAIVCVDHNPIGVVSLTDLCRVVATPRG